MRISEESYRIACAVLKCASKTSVQEAFSELEKLFYSPEELQKQHHIREMLRQKLEDSLGLEIQES